MTFFKTITFRLTIWYLAIFALLSGALGAGIYLSLSSTLRNNLDSDLIARSEQLSQFNDIISIIASGTFEEAQGEYISFYYYQGNKLEFISQRNTPFPIDSEFVDRALVGDSFFANIRTPETGLYRLCISRFKPENTTIDPQKFSPDNKRRRPPKPGRDDYRRKPDKRSLYDRNFDERPPERDRDNERQVSGMHIDTAALIIARPAGWIETILAYLKSILLLAIPIMLLLSGIGGVFLAGRALKPVKEITGTAHRINESDLSLRIPVYSQDELGTLSSTINKMIARLEKAFKRQKEFTSDASHELRAPLAVIQAEATLALQKERKAESYRNTIEVIANEADHMSSLTNKLLELARADSGKKEYTFTPVDLTSFVAETCSEISVLCQEKNIQFDQKLENVPQITGDLSCLRRILFNILTNAINYTEAGGAILVALKKESNSVRLSVTDSGDGIPESHLSYIFDRFYRVDKARSREGKSSGLGLSICKQLVDLHRGRITVKSIVGKGSCFDIILPTL